MSVVQSPGQWSLLAGGGHCTALIAAQDFLVPEVGGNVCSGGYIVHWVVIVVYLVVIILYLVVSIVHLVVSAV